MITKMATVAVYVEDQQAAKAFWTEKAGFDVTEEKPMGPGAFWLEVAPKGAETALVIYPNAMMPDAADHKPSIVFVCDDIKGTYQMMKDNGVQFEGELQEMPWGTFATFMDNEGNSYLLKG